MLDWNKRQVLLKTGSRPNDRGLITNQFQELPKMKVAQKITRQCQLVLIIKFNRAILTKVSLKAFQENN